MNVVVTGEEFNETLSFFASITHPKKKNSKELIISWESPFSFSQLIDFFTKL